YFLPADIISQILNFGLPAPIDVQVAGLDIDANRAFADNLLAKLRQVPGAADLRIQQVFDQPRLRIQVDRTKAAESGFTQLGVARDINRIVDRNRGQLPRGSQIFVRGQIETMRTSFQGLLGGLVLAIVLVYLLIVVNFQSWLDPFIIITALPAALAGVVMSLF